MSIYIDEEQVVMIKGSCWYKIYIFFNGKSAFWTSNFFAKLCLELGAAYTRVFTVVLITLAVLSSAVFCISVLILI